MANTMTVPGAIWSGRAQAAAMTPVVRFSGSRPETTRPTTNGITAMTAAVR